MAPHVIPLLLILLQLSHNVFAFNILAIVSLPLKSHYMAFQSLFRELAVKGHSVTVMNNFPDQNPPPNLRFIDMKLGKNLAGYITPLNVYEKWDSTYLHLHNFYRHLELSPSIARDDCENFFTNEHVKSNLAKGKKYDVIFVEMFMGAECGLAYAAALYDAPIIAITSHVMMPSAYPRIGIPFNFGTDAFYFSKRPNPSFYNKLEAFLMDSVYSAFYKWRLHGIVYDVFNKYLPNNTLDIEKAARERIMMTFSYQHFSLTGARLMAPQLLEIGGIHINQSKTLPQAVENFLSDAKHGAIYVSFGSNLKANTMTTEKLQEFLKAYKNVPQKVIWKYENASLPAGNNNVYIKDWLPQLDILCHPKVIGFVSHGGMLSLSEAAHCGKPVVIVPFFGDQFSNAAAAEANGFGYTLYFDRLNGDTLADGIRNLTSPRMQENAKRISRHWHDRPMSAMNSAIYWTEYVARHKLAPPSLPAKNSTWLQSSLLDVAAFVIVLLLAIFLVLKSIFNFLKFILSKLLGSKPQVKQNISKKKPKTS